MAYVNTMKIKNFRCHIISNFRRAVLAISYFCLEMANLEWAAEQYPEVDFWSIFGYDLFVTFNIDGGTHGSGIFVENSPSLLMC